MEDKKRVIFTAITVAMIIAAIVIGQLKYRSDSDFWSYNYQQSVL